MESKDNIAEVDEQPSVTDQPEPEKPNPDQTSQQKVPEFLTLPQAVELTAAHYKNALKQLKFSMPMQITDGCVCEFLDVTTGVAVASARVRFRNRIDIRKDSGEMNLIVMLSDLSFTRSSIDISLESAPQQTAESDQ